MDVIDLTADVASMPSTSVHTISHLSLTVTQPEFALPPNYVNILAMQAANVCRYLREAQRCAVFAEDGDSSEMLTPLAYTCMVRATLESVCKHKLYDDEEAVEETGALSTQAENRHHKKRKHDYLITMLPKLRPFVPLQDLQVNFEDIIAPLQTIQRLGNQAAHDCQAPTVEVCQKLWKCLKVLLHLVYIYPAQKQALVAERQRQQAAAANAQPQHASKKQRTERSAYADAATAAQHLIDSATSEVNTDTSSLST